MALHACFSPHPARPVPGCRRLTWLPVRGDERCRVVEWTCDCIAVFYELCQAGGQFYIRKTVNDDTAREITESHRTTHVEAREVWAAILTGRLR
ncbi:hypothetical protein OIE66_39620 [Nonomuraea sp. NBC_01738]|uniref:hypothetical protein n=1 Tax=Nonomuraea sp. NBC_01738 TaxID=2976003 RepID=UPI002E12EDDE|nr:hypothetical protein OIE66_39620 [Nonomuraea sp. NBC_01738]